MCFEKEGFKKISSLLPFMKLLQFQRLLTQQKIDLAFFNYTDPAVPYFIGREFTGGYFLITPRKAILLISPLDHKPQKKGITVHYLAKGWSKKYGSKQFKSVGINKSNLTVENLDRVRKIFPKAKIKDISSSLEQLRLEKVPPEILMIKRACDLTTAAFDALIRELPHRKLKTEQDVALFLETHIRKNGGTIAFPTIVAAGRNAAIPHHITSITPLRRGVLLLDFGARINSYCADMSRTILLGKPTHEEEEMYRLLAGSQQASLEAVEEGIFLSELDRIARQKLGKYASTFNHALGHGIGIEVHEGPSFSDPKATVTKNIPFTIEPGIYFPSKFGIRIEDTIVWNGKKLEVLTKATKRLTVSPF